MTSIERRAEERGQRQELVNGIELGLELKSGDDGLALMSRISQIEDLETLRAIRDAIRIASGISELQQIYKNA